MNADICTIALGFGALHAAPGSDWNWADFPNPDAAERFRMHVQREEGGETRYPIKQERPGAWRVRFREVPSRSPANPTPYVSGRYGAPMGRANCDTFTDKRGVTHKLAVLENAPPFRLMRVRLDAGGYDSGGAYWGISEPLYYFHNERGLDGFVRGRTREAAKSEVRELHPLARFYR